MSYCIEILDDDDDDDDGDDDFETNPRSPYFIKTLTKESKKTLSPRKRFTSPYCRTKCTDKIQTYGLTPNRNVNSGKFKVKMAHGSRDYSTHGSSFHVETNIADDLKSPIVKGLREQGFSQDAIKKALVQYRRKYPDKKKIIDSDLLDIVITISEGQTESRNKDLDIPTNTKKTKQRHIKGSTWINKLEAKSNGIFHGKIKVRLPQNLTKKFEKSVPSPVNVNSELTDDETRDDNIETNSDESASGTVRNEHSIRHSFPGEKSNTSENGRRRPLSHSSDSSMSEADVIEVDERITPIKKKQSNKSFKFDTSSNDTDSPTKRFPRKSSPSKAANKLRSHYTNKKGKDLKVKIPPVRRQRIESDDSEMEFEESKIDDKQTVSESDMSDEDLKGSSDTGSSKPNQDHKKENSKSYVQSNTKTQVDNSDKKRQHQWKLGQQAKDRAKQMITTLVKVSPVRGVNPWESVNVRKNSYIRKKIERESMNSSENKISKQQIEDGSSGNEFEPESPIVSVKKRKKRKHLLSTSSSEDGIDGERTEVNKSSVNKRIRKHSQAAKGLLIGNSNVNKDDDFTTCSSDGQESVELNNQDIRNPSSVSTACDDSDTDCSTSVLTEPVFKDVKSNEVQTSVLQTKINLSSSSGGKKDEQTVKRKQEDPLSESDDDLPMLSLPRRNSQRSTVFIPENPVHKTVKSPYDEATEKYLLSDYDIESETDSDKSSNSTKEKTNQIIGKHSVKPINFTSPFKASEDTIKVKPRQDLLSTDVVLNHSSDKYTIKSYKSDHIQSKMDNKLDISESDHESGSESEQSDSILSKSQKEKTLNIPEHATEVEGIPPVIESSLDVASVSDSNRQNETIDFINIDDDDDEPNDDSINQKKDFGYTQEDDCIYVEDDSDSEEMYKNLSQQVINVDDDDENDDEIEFIGDRNDDSDDELARFFNVHETDDEEDMPIDKQHIKPEIVDPEYRELYGGDDQDDEFNELMKDDGIDDEIDELMEEEKETVIKTEDDFTSDEDLFGEKTQIDQEIGNDNVYDAATQVQTSDRNLNAKKSSSHSNNIYDQETCIDDENIDKSDHDVSSDELFDEETGVDGAVKGSEETNDLYLQETQIDPYLKSEITSSSKSKTNDDRNLFESVFNDGYDEFYSRITANIEKKLNLTKELYEAETQVITEADEMLDKSNEIYDAQTQVATETYEMLDEATELYDAQTQVVAETDKSLDEPTDIYDAQTQVTTETDDMLEESGEIYNMQTQVISEKGEKIQKYKDIYDEQTQVALNSDNESFDEDNDYYNLATQVESDNFNQISFTAKRYGSYEEDNDDPYSAQTQVDTDEWQNDPYYEATQIDSTDSSVCIVDSDSSPVKVSKAQVNTSETRISISDASDSDSAFSSLTQVDIDSKITEKQPTDPYLGATQIDIDNSVGSVKSGNDKISSSNIYEDLSDDESDDAFSALTQIDKSSSRYEEEENEDPYGQSTQLDYDDNILKINSSGKVKADILQPDQQKQKTPNTEAADSSLVKISSNTVRKIISIPPQRLKSTQEKRESFRFEKGMFYSKKPNSNFNSKKESGKQERPSSFSVSNISKSKKRHMSGSSAPHKSKHPKKDDDPVSMTQQVSKAREEMERRMYRAASNQVPTAKQKKQQHQAEGGITSDVNLPDEEEILKKGLPVVLSPQKRPRPKETYDLDRSNATLSSHDKKEEDKEGDSGRTVGQEITNFNKHVDKVETSRKISDEGNYRSPERAERNKEREKDVNAKQRVPGAENKNDIDKYKNSKVNDSRYKDRNNMDLNDKKRHSEKSNEKDKHTREKDLKSHEKSFNRKEEKDKERREKDKDNHETPSHRKEGRDKERREKDKNNHEFISHKKEDRDKERRDRDLIDKRNSSNRKEERDKERKGKDSVDRKGTSDRKEESGRQGISTWRESGDKQNTSERNAATSKSGNSNSNQEKEKLSHSSGKDSVELNKPSDINSVKHNENKKREKQDKDSERQLSSINEANKINDIVSTNESRSDSNKEITGSTTKSILKIPAENVKPRSKSVTFVLPEVSDKAPSYSNNKKSGTMVQNAENEKDSSTKSISIDTYKSRQASAGSSPGSPVDDNGQMSISGDAAMDTVATLSVRPSNTQVKSNKGNLQQKYGSGRQNLMEKVPAQSHHPSGKENYAQLQPFVHPSNQGSSNSGSRNQPQHQFGSQGNPYAELQQKFGPDYVDYFLYRLLKWNPVWLKESGKPELAGITPPVITKEDGALTFVTQHFNSFVDYYKIFVPHLLHEVWEMCLRDWKELQSNGKSLEQKFYIDLVEPHPYCPELIYYKIYGILSKDQYNKGLVLKESSLIMLTTVVQSGKKFEHYPQFGLIEKVDTNKQPQKIATLLNSCPVLAEEAKKLRKELVSVHYTVKLKKKTQKNAL